EVAHQHLLREIGKRARHHVSIDLGDGALDDVLNVRGIASLEFAVWIEALHAFRVRDEEVVAYASDGGGIPTGGAVTGETSLLQIDYADRIHVGESDIECVLIRTQGEAQRS